MGVWLFIAPALFDYPEAARAHGASVLSGAVVVLLGAMGMTGLSQTGWSCWLNVGLGLLIAISPWLFGFAGVVAPTWNNVVSGLAIAGLSVFAALASRSAGAKA
jgi:hypothetical protein